MGSPVKESSAPPAENGEKVEEDEEEEEEEEEGISTADVFGDLSVLAATRHGQEETGRAGQSRRLQRVLGSPSLSPAVPAQQQPQSDVQGEGWQDSLAPVSVSWVHPRRQALLMLDSQSLSLPAQTPPLSLGSVSGGGTLSPSQLQGRGWVRSSGGVLLMEEDEEGGEEVEVVELEDDEDDDFVEETLEGVVHPLGMESQESMHLSMGSSSSGGSEGAGVGSMVEEEVEDAGRVHRRSPSQVAPQQDPVQQGEHPRGCGPLAATEECPASHGGQSIEFVPGTPNPTPTPTPPQGFVEGKRTSPPPPNFEAVAVPGVLSKFALSFVCCPRILCGSLHHAMHHHCFHLLVFHLLHSSLARIVLFFIILFAFAWQCHLVNHPLHVIACKNRLSVLYSLYHR